MVLSGGLSYDTVGRRACLTVMHGKSTTVLEMDFPIVDFLTLCETPYPNGELQKCKQVLYVLFFSFFLSICHFEISPCTRLIPDFQEPYAVVALLEKDLVVIDLGQIG